MLFAGVLVLTLCAYLMWWGRPVAGLVSSRIVGYDFYFSSGICLLLFVAVGLIAVGMTALV